MNKYTRSSGFTSHGLLLLFIISVFMACQSVEIRDPELNRNRQLWEQNNICNYNMVLEVRAGGTYTMIPEVEVQVRNGVVTEIAALPKEEVREIFRDKYEPYDTVEKLFDFVKSTNKEKHDRLSVSYDPRLRYPVAISVTYSGATDAYVTIRVKNFENLSIQNPCTK